jgi:hypothetical protein
MADTTESTSGLVESLKALPPNAIVKAMCAAERKFEIHIQQLSELTLCYPSPERLMEHLRTTPGFPPEGETTMTEASIKALSPRKYVEQTVWVEHQPPYVGYYLWRATCETAGFSFSWATLFRRRLRYVLAQTHVNFGVME